MELFKFAKNSTGLLLLGKPGLSMLEDAYAVATVILNTSRERLLAHPDFLYIGPQEGKNSIGVDASLQILAKGSLKPSRADRIICILDGIDKMTIPAQNKLLKLLEECSNIQVLAVAYSSQVLSTVKSRLRLVEYRPLTKRDFLQMYPEIPEVMYYATGGCPGLLEEMSSSVARYQTCFQLMSARSDSHKLLEELHLLKEKDPLSVTEKVSDMQATCRVLSAAIVENLRAASPTDGDVVRLTTLLKKMQEAECSVHRSTYSKDNFFELVMECIEQGNVNV